jgi:CHASE3 domain sensor protein/anti-anti-sigma regulatory factor
MGSVARVSAPQRSPGRLATRFSVVGAALAVLLVVAFVALLVAVSDLRHTSQAVTRSQATVDAAGQTERGALELSTALRGYLLLGERSILAPGLRAQAALPGQLAALRRLAAPDPAQARRAASLSALVRAYVALASQEIAVGSRRPRPELVAAAEAARRQLDRIRAGFGSFLSVERATAGRLDADASATARRAAVIGVVCFLILLAAIPLGLTYLARVVVAPVRAVGAAARNLAGGDLSARAPAAGAGEVAALARAFNSMADALEVSRTELERRGVRLTETNRDLRAAYANLEASKREAILALSTPVLQLQDRLLVLPLIGGMDVERARQVDDRLLAEVRARRARAVIVDVTGVPEIDTGTAEQLVRTVAAVRLLGARVIMTGVSGELAEALSGLDVDLATLHSYADLQAGVDAATGRR